MWDKNETEILIKDSKIKSQTCAKNTFAIDKSILIKYDWTKHLLYLFEKKHAFKKLVLTQMLGISQEYLFLKFFFDSEWKILITWN